MSYRAFKRLLGETSLERKCRFLLGAGILLLITVSFWWYAHLTENLAYNQTTTTCRLLLYPIIAKEHLSRFNLKNTEHWNTLLHDLEAHYPAAKKMAAKLLSDTQKRAKQVREVLESSENAWLDKLKEVPYQHQYFRQKHSGDPDEPQRQSEDPDEQKILDEFYNPEKQKNDATRQGDNVIYYYGAVRATRACLSCHQQLAEKKDQARLAENDLMAVVRIRMPTKAIEDRVHKNRAFLISTALVNALLIMGASYIIVRYVIVKPVKHLKEVSDAISAGELNVRSEIQTGDEFEDLSHAFNRMLRNLVSMQDRWRKVHADLDRKVDELAQANMALYESNRLKGDFLATMSHELRTPLNSILGFSEVLLSSDHLTDKQQRWLRNIQTSGERLLNLINDILDLAKIEAGKMQVRLEEFSIHDVAEGLINMFRPLAEKKNIDLRAQIDVAIPVLRQDVVKLQQILSNLLSNAIKFTPEGGRVLLKADADPLHVVITVADTGVGIAPEEQELVFEKFRQSGNPLTREHAGTGLGLSIVRELAKLLGGEVTLQSALGRGSTFTVRLPLQLSEEPRLEFDLAREHVDLSKAQRVDLRLYSGAGPSPGLRPEKEAPATGTDGMNSPVAP
jgi:two-component system sensor histidine kinase BarA